MINIAVATALHKQITATGTYVLSLSMHLFERRSLKPVAASKVYVLLQVSPVVQVEVFDQKCRRTSTTRCSL